MLFVLTELANWYGANAEDALRGTNAKVEARFRYVEERVRERGLSVSDVPLAELEAIWQQAKTLDRPPGVTEPAPSVHARGKRQASVAERPRRRPAVDRLTAWRPSTRRCSPGTRGSGATCPGAGRAIRTRSWSRRSCSSRPRWTG